MDSIKFYDVKVESTKCFFVFNPINSSWSHVIFNVDKATKKHHKVKP